MNSWYTASDYAGIETPLFKAYYGYERTVGPEDDEEWCFVANIDGMDEIVIPSSKLPGEPDRFNCEECLLAGLTEVLGEYYLMKV